MERTGRYHIPPPPRNPNPPPTNVPSNRSAERHEALPKMRAPRPKRRPQITAAAAEVTMIWKEIRTRRGLRRPSETKQGQRAMISLSDAVVCSGNPRAGGTSEPHTAAYKWGKPICHPYLGIGVSFLLVSQCQWGEMASCERTLQTLSVKLQVQLKANQTPNYLLCTSYAQRLFLPQIDSHLHTCSTYRQRMAKEHLVNTNR